MPRPLSQIWRLARHAHAVDLDDDLVVLDLHAGAYYCLPDVGERLRLAPARRTIRATEAAVAPLQAAGLLAGRGEPIVCAAPSPSPALPRPTATALRADYPPPGVRDLPPMMRASADLLAGYWRRPLAGVLRAALAGRPQPPAAPDRRLLESVDAFHRWVPYAPVSAKCLLRSFMLLRLLGRAGQGAHWVFGVRTWPFRAHCWLQCGEVVLDDHHERVAAFARILVL